MSAGIGFGGNARIRVGQMQITAAAQAIPFPSNLTGTAESVALGLTPTPLVTNGPLPLGIEGKRRWIIATDDIYIGPDLTVTPSGATGGFWIPANKAQDVTSRGFICFCGKTGAGVSSSSSLSASLGVSSSSSSSSLVPVVTLGTLYWLEELDV